MPDPPVYETLNKVKWDERAAVHAASKDYNLHQFVADPQYISETVRFDLSLLGSVTGLQCVHLQCHIGTDTLSLARLGAQSVTGLDFSSKSLNEARKLAAQTASSGGDKLSFVEASVYDALDVLESGTFDLVFTGIGALCWIPSVAAWAEVVSGLLKPGGRLFIREGHPVSGSMRLPRSHHFTLITHNHQPDNPASIEAVGFTYSTTSLPPNNNDPVPILQNLLKLLKPNGYLQWNEVDWAANTYLGLTATSTTLETSGLHRMRALGLSFLGPITWPQRMREVVEEQGLQDVVLEKKSAAGYPRQYARFWTDALVAAGIDSVSKMPEGEMKGKMAGLVDEAGEDAMKGVAWCGDHFVVVGRKGGG